MRDIETPTGAKYEPTMENVYDTKPLTKPAESRSETWETAKDDYDAEIKMLGYPVYQVKLADISPTGAAIVVKEDSSLLALLTVGRVLDVRFHGNKKDRLGAVEQFKAEASRYPNLKKVDTKVIGWSGFRCWKTNDGSKLIRIEPPPQIP